MYVVAGLTVHALSASRAAAFLGSWYLNLWLGGWRLPGPPKEPKRMAQYPQIESIGSIGSILLDWEVQVDLQQPHIPADELKPANLHNANHEGEVCSKRS